MKTLVATLLLCGCSAVQLEDGGPADINDGTKADGGPGIEVMARITPGTTDAVLSIAVPRLGYVFYAAEDSDVTLEVTHGGTDMGLDTKLVVYGPRLQNGQYIKTFVTDEDSGYGKLSRIKNFHVPMSGFYLVELAFGGNATPADGAHARLSFTCSGTCDTPDPIVPIDEGLKWYRRSAERRVLTSEVYAMATQKLNDKVAAGAPAGWAVVLDVDETTLNNSAYQQARLDLGVGYSPGSWTTWVNQRAATAIDGVADFTHTAKQLGGTVALVTNRKAVGECQPTEDNLHALGIEYDVILCQVDVSDKNPRFQQLAQMGYTAIEYVGDNILDFPALTQDLRNMDASAFDQFGQDYFLIPNPMYGSFDKNTTPDTM